MKKLLFTVFIILAFCFMALIEIPAQIKTRVRFAKGATSVTVKGNIAGFKYIDYLVGANSGQRMSVKLNSANQYAQFVIFKSNYENLAGATGETDWSDELPENGNYIVRVLLSRVEARRKGAAANYSLRISIR